MTVTHVRPVDLNAPTNPAVPDAEGGGGARRWRGRSWLTTGLVLALLAAMVVHLAGTTDELLSVRRLSVGILAITFLLQFVSQLLLNASMLLPLRTCLKDLGFWELYLVRTGGFLFGSLVPVAGGVAVRLAYLRQRGVSYLDFTWATLLSNVLALAAAGLVAVAGIAMFSAVLGSPPRPVLVVAAALFAAGGAGIAVFESIPRATRYSGFRRWAWLAGMASLRDRPAMAAGVLGHSVGRHSLNFITFGILAQSLSGTRGDFLSGGVLYALTSPVRMINITPGNLGVTEWVVALVGEALAFDLTIGLLAALAFRGISLAAAGVGILIASAAVAHSRRPATRETSCCTRG